MATLRLKKVLKIIPLLLEDGRFLKELTCVDMEGGQPYLAIKKDEKGNIVDSKIIIFNGLRINSDENSDENSDGYRDNFSHKNYDDKLVVVAGYGWDEEELDNKTHYFYTSKILHETKFIPVPGTNFVSTQIADEEVILLEVSNDKEKMVKRVRKYRIVSEMLKSITKK